jgi:hypothetical protein
LFDSDESLAGTVAGFLSEGLDRNAPLLAVMTRPHWVVTARRLDGLGVPVSEHLSTGRLTVVDATELLKQVAPSGFPDSALFDRAVGSLVRRLAGDLRGLFIFGEMVDLLAAQGDFRAVERLETLWNLLAEREPYTLFCGYSSVSFGDVRSSGALRRICAAHSHIQMSDQDRLGSWLVTSTTGGAQPATGSP